MQLVDDRPDQGLRLIFEPPLLGAQLFEPPQADLVLDLPADLLERPIELTGDPVEIPPQLQQVLDLEPRGNVPGDGDGFLQVAVQILEVAHQRPLVADGAEGREHPIYEQEPNATGHDRQDRQHEKRQADLVTELHSYPPLPV